MDSDNEHFSINSDISQKLVILSISLHAPLR